MNQTVKKNLGIKKKYHETAKIFKKTRKCWDLHQISFSYLTTSYAPNKEIKMSDHVKKKYISI
jgi:hypothetical protein